MERQVGFQCLPAKESDHVTCTGQKRLQGSKVVREWPEIWGISGTQSLERFLSPVPCGHSAASSSTSAHTHTEEQSWALSSEQKTHCVGVSKISPDSQVASVLISGLGRHPSRPFHVWVCRHTGSSWTASTEMILACLALRAFQLWVPCSRVEFQ